MTAALPELSLLEAGRLPVEDIARLAIREGRRPRPIYAAHKWFARRLGVVFRSLLVGATRSPGEDFWGAYYGGADLRDLLVLDPFVGGGTSVVEAQRLGASVAASDVDPIACAVTSFELGAEQIPDLRDALAELQSTVGKSIRSYHEVTDTDGKAVEVLHHFWVQQVHCSRCESAFDAHPNFWLSKMPDASWAFCHCCGLPQVVASSASKLDCRGCGASTRLDEGTVDYGRATCPTCGESIRLIEVGRETEMPPFWRLFAQEVLDDPDGGRAVPMAKRRFVAAGDAAAAKFEAARLELSRLEGQGTHVVAGGPILAAAQTDTRLTDYGYRDWADLYNARQRLHLAMLGKAIMAYPEPTRRALVMAFSDHLTTNCMMTSYAAGWRRMTPLFSIRGFRHVPRPIEINPWMDGTGRGTYPNTVKKLLRARDFARSPKEPTAEGGFKAVPSSEPRTQARVRVGSSTDLGFLERASVDIVLTDPPYFDNIAYSELAEFFLPWLRHFGVVVDEGVDRVLLDSLVSRRADEQSIASFTAGLTSVFGEVSRVLKPGGIMVFSFRHILPGAWEALAMSIHPHPFTCIRVLPMPGETGTGLQAHDGAGLWDAVFVLRRQPDGETRRRNAPEVAEATAAIAVAEAAQWTERLRTSAIRFGAPDAQTIRMAAVVGACLGVAPGDGQPLHVALAALMES